MLREAIIYDVKVVFVDHQCGACLVFFCCGIWLFVVLVVEFFFQFVAGKLVLMLSTKCLRSSLRFLKFVLNWTKSKHLDQFYYFLKL